MPRKWLVTLMACLLVAAVALPALAQENKYPGWEEGSDYMYLYDPANLEEWKGEVTEILEVVPMPGMHPAVAFRMKDKRGDDVYMVQVGPKDFVDLSKIGLRVGDQVKVRGVEVDINDEPVILVNKVKSNGGEIKPRRTEDGKAGWLMTPEEYKAMQN